MGLLFSWLKRPFADESLDNPPDSCGDRDALEDEDSEVYESVHEVVTEVSETVKSSQVDQDCTPEKIVASLAPTDLSVLRTLVNPPALVKTVLESVYVVLGHKDKDVKEWAYLKKQLAGTGKSSLKALCLKVEPWNLKEDTVKVVRTNYLSNYSVDKVIAVSSGGAILAKWVFAVIRAAEHYLSHPGEAEERRKEEAEKLASDSKPAPASSVAPQKSVKIGPLDKRCVSDLKALAKPQQTVVDVLSAVNVLLGQGITKKQDWKEIKKGLDAGLIQACLMLDPSKVDPSAAEFACTHYLDGMSASSVAKINLAAGSFFVWAQSMIQDVHSWHNLPDSRAEIEERRRKEREAAHTPQTVRPTGAAAKVAPTSPAKSTGRSKPASDVNRTKPTPEKSKPRSKQPVANPAPISNGSVKTKAHSGGLIDMKRPASGKLTGVDAAASKPVWK